MAVRSSRDGLLQRVGHGKFNRHARIRCSQMRGAIIAGGKATRYGGRPKGLEKVGGERILDLLAARMTEALGAQPAIVANDPDASTWMPGFEVVTDPRPDCGSLGGIYTAVTAENGPVLVVAWDMPFVTAKLLRMLAEEANGHDVFLPVSQSRHGMEPLCGVYSPSCAGPIEERLNQEDYRAIGFHDKVKVGFLPLEKVKECGDSNTLFFNINSPEDLRKAEELWRSRD